MLAVRIKILGTIIVIGACIFTTLYMLKVIENPSSEFATYAEMEASGLIEARWIPEIIPRSAFEISETHNVDTNVVRISFRFSPEDISIAQSECRSESVKSMDLVFKCPDGTLTLTDDGHGYFTSE